MLIATIFTVRPQISYGASQWYIGIDAGTGLRSEMRHTDMFVSDSCAGSGVCELQTGGRWNYSLNVPRSWTMQLNGGYEMSKVRLELAVERQSSVMDQSFTTHAPSQNSNIVLPANYRIERMGELKTSSVILGAYYVIRREKAAAYLGGGLGLTQSIVADVLYDDPDSCTPGQICHRVPISHKMSGHEELRDMGLSQHLSAGLDYDIGNQFLIGLKLTYRRLADVHQTVDYEFRPDIGSADTTIGGIYSLSAVFSLKYLFRRTPAKIAL